MIAPTYYRSLLTSDEQELYKVIVNDLIMHKKTIYVRQNNLSCDVIQRVVKAIHFDHPELFFVNFWQYHFQQILTPFDVRIEFQMLLDKGAANSVANTLAIHADALQNKMEPEMSLKQKYYQVVKKIASTTTYVNSGSGFWDHTCVGPILKGSGVCESIAKLFLYFCQRLQLPCAILTGTLNGIPHAWNMIEINNTLRYIDVTSLLNTSFCYALFSIVMFQNEDDLRQNGYKWEKTTSIP